MRQHHDTLTVDTPGPGLTDITPLVTAVVHASKVSAGSCTVMVLHTSASLVVQENADPAVQRDLERFMRRLVPDGDPLYEHDAEGPDDMPSHVKSALTQTTLTIPVLEGRLRLGTWQGIQLWEHRRRGHRRKVAVHVLGE